MNRAVVVPVLGLLSLSLLCALSVERSCEAAEPKGTPVRVAGCPTIMRVTFPGTFKPATTAAEKLWRARYLDELNALPLGKYQYSDVVAEHWGAAGGTAAVTIGADREFLSLQGRISPENWQEIRKLFLSVDTDQLSDELRALANRLANSGIAHARGRIASIYEEDGSTMVAPGTKTQSGVGGEVRVYSAAKLVYRARCLAAVTLLVPESQPHAIDTVVRFVADLKVH